MTDEQKKNQREYQKKWRDANKEKVKAYRDGRLIEDHACQKKWRDENRERMNENNKKYRAANKELFAKSRKKWRENNPHKVAEQVRLRNTLLEQAIPNWYEDELVKQLYLKRNELNEKYAIDLVVDHIIPINPRDGSVCGLHCWANLQLLDKFLNGEKCDFYQTDW